MKKKQNNMVGLSFFSIIIVSLSLTNCNYDSDTVMNNKPKKTADNFSDSTQIDFDSFIKKFENEGIVEYESLSYFLPDSVLLQIPVSNGLYAEFNFEISNRIILRINSNGENSGEILLFCFSELGKLIDYLIIKRYCSLDCENVGVAKEIVITNKTNVFEFEVIETEHKNPKSMPLFKDNQEYKKEKWKLNDSGKFVAIN